MSDRAFVDTNVLVYADDRSAGAKRDQARELLRRLTLEGRIVLSLQVLQEYFATATRKLGLSASDARRRVETFARLALIKIDAPDLLAAIDLHRLHQFSIWDCLILRAAQVANCSLLYTEDLQHGQRIDSLEVVNPFRG